MPTNTTPAKHPPFYITTPLYYVNDVPHIGHAYTTIAADVLARFKRLDGFDVFFLTGTDEHGQKIERTALQSQEEAQAFVDRMVVHFKDLWKKFEITYDDFIRTTEERHKKVVLAFVRKLLEKGDIYLGQYEDWYCTPCETFWTSQQLTPQNQCPSCHRSVERLKEESYFFRLSKYRQPLIEYFGKHPAFVQPESRQNEILSILHSGLHDLSMSRTAVQWGIAMPDTGLTKSPHIVYVWVDALINYISALGFLDTPDRFHRFWPTALHLIGKDIVRHHAIYWPALLLALDLPLPRGIFAHGWWTIEGKKMSKSFGNVVSPIEMTETFGLDPFRYFLLREVPFGLDGNFSRKAMIDRINNDLANDLGNTLQRTVTMVIKYSDGIIDLSPSLFKTRNGEDEKLRQEGLKLLDSVRNSMDLLSFDEALRAIWSFVRASNQYLDSTSPWRVAKDPSQNQRLKEILAHSLESLRLIALSVAPVMPQSAQIIWQRLGIERKLGSLPYSAEWQWGDAREPSRKVVSGEPLFPRIEEAKS